MTGPQEKLVFRLPRTSIEELAGPMTDRQAARLAQYAGMVAGAVRTQNLVSSGDRERLDEHIVDSAALLRAVTVDGAVADLGSGAGLPGVVVGVLRPDVPVSLVESRRRKVAFLKRVVRTLALENVTVVHARLESLACGERYRLAASRALGDIEKTLAVSLRVVEPGGRLVLFKGPRWRQERERAVEIARAEGAELEREAAVELPGLDRTTTFVVFHVKQE